MTSSRNFLPMFVAPKIAVRLSTELDNMSMDINYCPGREGSSLHIPHCNHIKGYLNQLCFAGDSDRSDWQVSHFVAGGR
jgi:hypothetical protein